MNKLSMLVANTAIPTSIKHVLLTIFNRNLMQVSISYDIT